MAALKGIGNHVASGEVTITSDDDSGINLQFKDLQLEQVLDPRAYLTVDGDLNNSLPAGKLPQSEGTFSMMIAAGADISPYNTLIIRDRKSKTDIGIAQLY